MAYALLAAIELVQEKVDVPPLVAVRGCVIPGPARPTAAAEPDLRGWEGEAVRPAGNSFVESSVFNIGYKRGPSTPCQELLPPSRAPQEVCPHKPLCPCAPGQSSECRVQRCWETPQERGRLRWAGGVL